MTATDAPPPLDAMAARKAKIEAQRTELFPRWKAALTEAKGNITDAAVTFILHGVRSHTGSPAMVRAVSCAKFWNRTLGLREYAAELRRQAGQGVGRPKKHEHG